MEIINFEAACDDCLKVTDCTDVSPADEDALFDVAENLTNKEANVKTIQCPTCHKCALLKCGDKFYNIGLLLKADHHKDGIHKLEEEENPYLVLLLELCYNVCEREESYHESPFVCSFLHTDIIKLIWRDGQAVGFYVLKVKGSILSTRPLAKLSMPQLDVVYVRRAFRRQGLGRAVLDDVIQETLGVAGTSLTNLGVSEPLSDSLLKVLERYLTDHPSYRDYIWACTYTGEDGYRKNIWLDLQRIKRQEKECL